MFVLKDECAVFNSCWRVKFVTEVAILLRRLSLKVDTHRVFVEGEVYRSIVRVGDHAHVDPPELEGKTMDHLTGEVCDDVVDNVQAARQVQQEGDVHVISAA